MEEDTSASAVAISAAAAAVSATAHKYDDDQSLLSDPSTRDRFHLVLVVFALLGCGLLLPYNAFISGADYFDQIYPCEHTQFYFSTTYMITLFCTMVVAVRFGENFRYNSRILPGYFAFFVSLVVSLLVRKRELHILMVFITGVADGVVQHAIYSLAAVFPPEYLSACMVGTGAAGTSISIIRIATIVFSSSEYASFQIFFGISAGFVVLCLVSWIAFLRSPYAQMHVQGTFSGVKREERKQELQSLERKSSDSSEIDDVDEERRPDSEKKLPTTPVERVKYVSKCIVVPAATIFLNFFVTLALFPGVTVEIKPESGENVGNFVVALIASFNFFDLVGRFFTKWPLFRRILSPRHLLIASILRLVFVPIFLLRALPGGINSDIVAFATMILFALSNGYIGALAMVQAPQCVPPALRETAGSVMGFSLMFGLTCGAITGMCLGAILFVSGPCA